jgi:hypothetical protein
MKEQRALIDVRSNIGAGRAEPRYAASADTRQHTTGQCVQ